MNETLQREYDAAIAGAGVVRLRDWSTVRAAGNDRATFLHNMCTNDVKRLTAGEGCEAFFTDVKGKIVAHGFLLAGLDAIEIVTVPGTAPRLIAQLDRYVIREDVALSDESREVAWMLLFGEQARGILERAVGADVGKLSAAWTHRTFDVAGIAVRIARCELPWMGGFLLGCPNDAAAAIEARLAAAGATIGSEALWQTVRVESNWPLWGIDFDESNLPQEISRDAQAISFCKGCYLGQETVARIDALGHVNKQLVQVLFEGPTTPEVGADLFNGDQPVGRVTSATTSSRWGGPAALAMVRRGSNAAGTTLRWNGGARVIVAPGSTGG